MKHFSAGKFMLMLAVAAVLISCGQKSPAVSDDNKGKAEEQNASGKTEEANLDFLKKYDGKYAYEVHLFEKKVFADRLSKLIGEDNFKTVQSWDTEMPMEYRNNVFVAEGCKPHDCGSNNYIVVYDFSEDAMYAGILTKDEAATFSENGKSSERVEKWKPFVPDFVK